MVSGVENNLTANNALNVGVLSPPNALHKPQLYSDKAAESQFKQITNDIYQKENSEKFENKRKTPISVFITVCAAAVGAGWLVFRKALKW